MCWRCTQRNIFVTLLNQTEIKLYLLFSDWFRTNNHSVRFQINQEMVNTISFQFNLTRFRKNFSVCICTHRKIFLLPYKLRGICDRSYRFLLIVQAKRNPICSITRRKLVNTVVFLPIWQETDIQFSACRPKGWEKI